MKGNVVKFVSFATTASGAVHRRMVETLKANGVPFSHNLYR
jgi:hypothetical protein